jgi:pyrroloquinoline quinone biosynthesis protein B
MHVRILGSAAGGGFPQWNCNCCNCAGLRNGTLRARARTQSSIALSADGAHWVLFNASPDIRAQLESFPPLRSGRAVRDTGIVAVLLVDSQIDHTTGLLMLREGRSLRVYCTDPVFTDLTGAFPLFNVLQYYCGVDRHPVPIDGLPFSISGIEGLHLRAIPLRSQAPPYSPHRADPHPGDTIGVSVEDLATGGKLFYAPGLGRMEAHLHTFLAEADCLLVDGTFWQDDEMIRMGLGERTAREMGHLPQTGQGGMIEALRPYSRPRKILIHINNSNPILDEASEVRAVLAAEGIEVAFDGMEIML